MDYVYEMARTLREERGLPLTLLIEKPVMLPAQPEWVTVQRYTHPLLRIAENVWHVVIARRRGVTTFYVHYSFLSAITTGLVARLGGGTVYYWNAGMPWLYQRSWTEEWYQRLAYKCIHTLVTGAEALREGYQTMYGLRAEQVVVIPNWIDVATVRESDGDVRHIQRAALRIATHEKIVLFVHKLSRRKGADMLIPIYDALADPTVHLVVAGDGPLWSMLEQTVTERGLATRVHLLGKVPRVEVAALLQAADVFLMPSEEEGSPHALIEAMAYGVPFVAYDVGGVAETATPALADGVVPARDTSAAAAALRRFLGDPAAAADFVRREAVVVARYAKPRIVEAFYQLLWP